MPLWDLTARPIGRQGARQLTLGPQPQTEENSAMVCTLWLARLASTRATAPPV